jgi:DNA-binding NtrC family response regulator
MATILVIDDDEDLRALIAEVLECSGHSIRAAANGLDGLHELDQEFPELVVSDVDMPILSGPAMVLRMLIENLGREKIPVLVVSATPNVAKLADTMGTPYYLAKPFTAGALVDEVDRALAGKEPPHPRPLEEAAQFP